MGRCDYCGYNWADLDDEGTPISREHCHWVGPDDWAPCAQDDEYDYTNEEYESYMSEYEEDDYYDWVERHESDSYEPDWEF